MGFPNAKARAAFFARKAAKDKGMTSNPAPTTPKLDVPQSSGGLKVPTVPVIDKPHDLEVKPIKMKFTSKPVPMFPKLGKIIKPKKTI